MKAIEREMLNAMSDGKKHWSKDNTSIERLNSIEGTQWYKYSVRLHGNHIATVIVPNPGQHRVLTYVDYETLREYPTVTTKSRLRALGVNVYTKAYTTYVDDEPIN